MQQSSNDQSRDAESSAARVRLQHVSNCWSDEKRNSHPKWVQTEEAVLWEKFGESANHIKRPSKTTHVVRLAKKKEVSGERMKGNMTLADVVIMSVKISWRPHEHESLSSVGKET